MLYKYVVNIIKPRNYQNTNRFYHQLKKINRLEEMYKLLN